MRSVRSLVLLALCALALPIGTAVLAAERMAFWNLTSATITRLTMAPAGTGTFGPDQCANDHDGSVDHDERLRLTGIEPGRYDVQLVTKPTPTKPARTCTIHDVEVKGSGRYAFSLADGDLTECN